MEPVEIVSKQLEKQNEILQRMLDIMPRPASKLMQRVEMGILFITALGVVNAVDIILKWVFGG